MCWATYNGHIETIELKNSDRHLKGVVENISLSVRFRELTSFHVWCEVGLAFLREQASYKAMVQT